MEDRDLDSLRQKPDFKHIVRAVLKHQMKYLVEQLSRYGEEEVMVLATSVQGGVVSHLGSPATDGFLENREDIKSQFLGHCRRQSFIERPESAVHRSENSSLQDVQTAIPQTHQYITAGSTLTCAVQPGIAVDSSPTFTSTLSSIGTQSVDMNMHPNTVNTQPNSNLHYPQSLSWQTTQVAPHNQSKAPMTGVTRTVKPTKSGVKRPCETVTSDKCSSIKTVRVCSSDIRDKNTALPTFIECTTEHTDAKKRDDDKSVEHLENSTEMQAVNDDSIFDDYVLGQFDGVEKSTDAPDTSNDQVSDDSSQIHQLTSDTAGNGERKQEVMKRNTIEVLIDGRKELMEVNRVLVDYGMCTKEVNTEAVPMDHDLCKKQKEKIYPLREEMDRRNNTENENWNVEFDKDLNRNSIEDSTRKYPLSKTIGNSGSQNKTQSRSANTQTRETEMFTKDADQYTEGSNKYVQSFQQNKTSDRNESPNVEIKSEEKDAQSMIYEIADVDRRENVKIDLSSVKIEYSPRKQTSTPIKVVAPDVKQKGNTSKGDTQINDNAEKKKVYAHLNETTSGMDKDTANKGRGKNKKAHLKTKIVNNETGSIKQCTVEDKDPCDQSVCLQEAPENSHFNHDGDKGNDKCIPDEAQKPMYNHLNTVTASVGNKEIAKSSAAADDIEYIGDKVNRKSYCFSFKLEVIKYAEENGNYKAEKHYKIRESTIRGWRKQKQTIETFCKDKQAGRLKSRKLRTPQWPEMEEKLLAYLAKTKSEGKVLRKSSILKIAVKIAKEIGITDFKASTGWLRRFKQRNGLYNADT